MKKLLLCLALVLSINSVYANSLTEIKQQNKLRIGLSDKQPPFSQYQDGEFEGFEVEFAKEIAKAVMSATGITEVEYIPVAQADRFKAVTENKVDLLIAAFTKTPARAKQADFSIPYFSITLGTTSKKSLDIKKQGDLNGKKVLTIGASNSDIWVKNNPNITQIPCKNNKDCFEKLQNGEADAYMHNIVSIATVPLLDDEFEISIPRIGEILFDCVVTQKGNADLLKIVNQKILDLANESFFKEAYNNTFEPFYKGLVDKKYFLLDDLYKTLLLY